MAIIIDNDTTVLVQGITGYQGRFHTEQMLKYGTRVVAGTSPGKGGQEVAGVPVYDTVREAAQRHRPVASILFVPAQLGKEAALEALEAGIKLLVIISEHIPLHDSLEIMSFARARGAMVLGPNTFGVISSGRSKIGIMPNQFFQPGPVGVVSRSGTLGYEIVGAMRAAGLGTSTVVGMGGDRVVGLNFMDILREFEQDPETEAIVLIGEIGGTAEEEAAAFIKEKVSKPVVAYIAGASAPPGKRMGHAGAIIERGRGTYAAKVAALRAAGVKVAELPQEVPSLLKKVLR
ncbi:MAG: succinyl-CoA synthetase alpha subunit [Bacillota bacterium]|jgi:succinyl-CoA synthetase alpha subunit|nr:succinyl-CoA synthetase alpha subunit [Bacillota bacterium]MDK2960611.1 succinyl-CoA synthetase alpha subunit [Bacillota bacterium]